VSRDRVERVTEDADLQLTFGILISGYVVLEHDGVQIRLNREIQS